METVSFDSFSRSATAGHRPWDLTRLLHSLDTKHGIAHRIQKTALFYCFLANAHHFIRIMIYIQCMKLCIVVSSPSLVSSEYCRTLYTTDAQWSNTSWSKLKFYHLQTNLFPDGSGNHMPAQYPFQRTKWGRASWWLTERGRFLSFFSPVLSSLLSSDKTI